MNEDRLVIAVRDQMLAYGLTLEVGTPAGETAVVSAGTRGSRTYELETRYRVTAAAAGAISARGPRPLLIAPHIADGAADVLRSRGIDFVDASGNAHLSWPGLLVDVRGRRKAEAAVPRHQVRAASRAFTRSGAQVVFVVLSWPELTSVTVRDLARASGVSVGTAQVVLADLTSSGYLYANAGKRTLARGGELLTRWTEAYALRLAPKLALAAFAVEKPRWWDGAEQDLSDTGVQLGGELAASLLDPNLRPATAEVYVDEVPAALVARYRMTPDDGGTVFFRRRFWTMPEDTSDLVPLPLIYADLLASGDPRQREHAERLRGTDDRLARLDRS